MKCARILISCVCVAVLKAIYDDSPNVPAMLTEYILKGEYINVICVLIGEFSDKCYGYKHIS